MPHIADCMGAEPTLSAKSLLNGGDRRALIEDPSPHFGSKLASFNKENALETVIEETSRAVNRRLRADRRREKLMEAWRLRGLGAGVEFLHEATARWPGQWRRQLRFFFDAVPLLQRVRKPTETTESARERFFDRMECMFYEMVLSGIPLRDLNDVGRAEVISAIQLWLRNDCAVGTVQVRLSDLRRFFILIGRPEVIPVHAEFTALLEGNGIDPARLLRAQVRSAGNGD